MQILGQPVDRHVHRPTIKTARTPTAEACLGKKNIISQQLCGPGQAGLQLIVAEISSFLVWVFFNQCLRLWFEQAIFDRFVVCGFLNGF